MGLETLAKDYRQERERCPNRDPRRQYSEGQQREPLATAPIAKLAMALFTFQSWSLSTRRSGQQNLGS